MTKFSLSLFLGQYFVQQMQLLWQAYFTGITHPRGRSWGWGPEWLLPARSDGCTAWPWLPRWRRSCRPAQTRWWQRMRLQSRGWNPGCLCWHRCHWWRCLWAEKLGLSAGEEGLQLISQNANGYQLMANLKRPHSFSIQFLYITTFASSTNCPPPVSHQCLQCLGSSIHNTRPSKSLFILLVLTWQSTVYFDTWPGMVFSMDVKYIRQ